MTVTGALEVTAPGDRDIVMTRVFDAPRDLVFRAYTEPEILKRWLLGPDGWTMIVCDVDLRVGGSYRYVWRNAAGVEMGMGGTYREIAPPERIVATEEFDQEWYPGEAVGTLVFSESQGRTTLRQTMTYASREARDMVLNSPMETGVAASFNRLAALLPGLAATG